jgi:hypothetical protein
MSANLLTQLLQTLNEIVATPPTFTSIFSAASAKQPKALHIFLLTSDDTVLWLIGASIPMGSQIHLIAGSQFYDQVDPDIF